MKDNLDDRIDDTVVVDCKDILYSREDKDILRDVCWQIRKGQNWAFLGANGSGKTTLLKIITGYEWPTKGTVAVLGNQYGKCQLREVRKTIGWVSSNIPDNIPGKDRAIDIVVSGIEASMGLYREYSREEYDRAMAALELLSSERFANQTFRTLSQGERQRTLIARALINEPKLLVLDEPCSGLDPASKELFLGDLEKLANMPEAPGIIYVSHHIDEIRDWITNIFVIKNGQKLAEGDKDSVLKDEILSEAFGCECKVRQNGSKYWLEI